MVLRYVADAPLLQVTAEYRRRNLDCSMERALTSDHAELESRRLRLAELDRRTAAFLAAQKTCRAHLEGRSEGGAIFIHHRYCGPEPGVILV